MIPKEAYELAIKEGPSDNTRKTACESSWYSYLYAKEIDKGPNDTTRTGAYKDPDCAYLYSVNIDGYYRKDALEAMLEKPFVAENYRKHFHME